MPLGIGTGIGIRIGIVSRAAAGRGVGDLRFNESTFMPGIEPIPGMAGIVVGFVGGLGGV